MKAKILFSLPLIALLAAGCATTKSDAPGSASVTTTETVTVVDVEPIENGAAPVAVLPPQIPGTLNSVEFVTQELVDRLVVSKTGYERTPSQAFKVTCTLRNLTGEPLRLQARTQYFSDDRTHQEGPGAWQMVFVPANGMETYTAYSYGTNLSYYYVEIQEM